MDFGGAWRTQHCDNERNQYVVCETRSPECTIKDVHEEGLCPVPFTENCLDYCYHVVPGGGTPTKPGVQISWRQAKIECEKLNSTLASVRSPADLVCIQDVIQFSGKPLWIGLEEVWSSEIGNYTWRWMNGDVLTSNWNNWSPGEPNYLTTIRDSCVEMYSNGKWNNVNCNDNGPRNGYVCEKRKIPYTRSSTVAVATSSMPLVTQPVSVASTNFPPPTHSPDPTTTSHSINGSRSAGGFKSGGHSGSYAGAAIAVIVLVAGLTCASYFVWHRRASGRSLTSRSTLKTSYKSGGTGVDNDITPVIGLEDDNHDVTYT
ncbi:hypothetical protein BV898_12633 [Hypsibius exemplaris]|uniref:C-type lectin domain-containing protein n=1 Tax=Hypsibius exemplaris TaxID=2072580 RepID=A0A1W0WD06_HYPEX|nr:hypothetical protein BV898_12633 [Hypsibius exemplaris]